MSTIYFPKRLRVIEMLFNLLFITMGFAKVSLTSKIPWLDNTKTSQSDRINYFLEILDERINYTVKNQVKFCNNKIELAVENSTADLREEFTGFMNAQNDFKRQVIRFHKQSRLFSYNLQKSMVDLRDREMWRIYRGISETKRFLRRLKSSSGQGNTDDITELNLHKEYHRKYFKCVWERPFPVNGQGTFIFNGHITKNLTLFISVEDFDGKNSLVLRIDKDKVYFLKYLNYSWYTVVATSEQGSGIDNGKIDYWFSYDRDNLVLKYGKGYRMEETTLLSYDFLKDIEPTEEDKVRQDMYPFFNPIGKKYVRQYQQVEPPMPEIGIGIPEEKIQFDENPFICNIPPLILDSSQTNMFLLDQGEYVFSASLPVASKELYENVRNCELDYPEEVDSVLLSESIRYSIKTEGCF